MGIGQRFHGFILDPICMDQGPAQGVYKMACLYDTAIEESLTLRITTYM